MITTAALKCSGTVCCYQKHFLFCTAMLAIARQNTQTYTNVALWIWFWYFLYKLGIRRNYLSCSSSTLAVLLFQVQTWSMNKVRELATMCLPWQHWTKTILWFDGVHTSSFHSCVVVVDLWQSLSEWHLLLSACVSVCRRENVGAWIRATNEH